MTDIEVAIAAAESGASIVRERFATALDRLDKGGGDFATSADVDAENAMLAIPVSKRSTCPRRSPTVLGIGRSVCRSIPRKATTKRTQQTDKNPNINPLIIIDRGTDQEGANELDSSFHAQAAPRATATHVK
jgi:hypothetical protein